MYTTKKCIITGRYLPTEQFPFKNFSLLMDLSVDLYEKIIDRNICR